MRKPFLRHHDSVLFSLSDPHSCASLQKQTGSALRREDVTHLPIKGIFSDRSDEMCPKAALFLEFIQSPVIGVLLCSLIFEMIADVYIKVICAVHLIAVI